MSTFQTPNKQIKKPDDGERIIIPPSPFLSRLGYGTGVNVMQLVRSPKAGQVRSPWALKMLNKRVKQHKVYAERITSEAELLKRMSHPNVVGFRAFSVTKTLFLGMEACDVSLGDMIEKRVDDAASPFNPTQILKVALDIGKALDYIHTQIKILHGDMKSFNVLVNGDFKVCKLCDFGVTLPLDQDGKFDKEKAKDAVYFGTEAWSAPEVLSGGEISSKTDIWPFGLTLWEMMALSPPHVGENDTLDTSTSEMSFEEGEVMFSENYGTRPEIPVDICEKQYADPLAIFFFCTQSDPRSRPSAEQVVKAVEDMTTKINNK